MRGSDLIRIAVLAAGLTSAATAADAPRRVVSMNLCTDQLAMMVAGDGQLVSVSDLAFDPRSSAMVREAQAYPTNHGLAEEIYLLRPELVLAGRFTARATVDMLRRLGVPVAIFDPADSLDDVRDRITRMGEALGRSERAAQVLADYDAGRAALQTQVARRPDAALYEASGYTAGDQTLAGQILLAAGFENVAAKAGFDSAGYLPLEVLAMAQPDAVITSQPYPGASRAEEIMLHPVVRTLRASRTTGNFTDHDWVCGTPFVLRAIADMAEVRKGMDPR